MYELFGVTVKFVDALFTLPDVGPVKVKVVALRVIVTGAFIDVETFPAASFAQAYSVFDPWVANVYVVGAVPDHPESLARGAEEDSLIK